MLVAAIKHKSVNCELSGLSRPHPRAEIIIQLNQHVDTISMCNMYTLCVMYYMKSFLSFYACTNDTTLDVSMYTI